MFKRYLVYFLLLCGLGAGVVLLRALDFLHSPVSADTVVYEIKPGASLTGVAYDLHQSGHITEPRVLVLWARLQGNTEIQAGEYRFESGKTPLQWLAQMNRGDVIRYQVTLVEGWTWKEALQALHKQPKLTHTLQGLDMYAVAEKLGMEKGQHLEGMFFPDTYSFTSGDSDLDVLLHAYEALQAVLEEEWQGRASGLPYTSSYEALIMASIIEKETGVPEERGDIAGVFVRRLEKRMRLQTDPTVIYGLGDEYTGNLKRKHLSQHTPYNTYMIHGLPPTPIALAGREAIHAALHPLDGDSLFFVARGDGSHYFSATLEEHTQAVRKYQLQRRKDYRSSPAAQNNTTPETEQ
jgi:UPF0755 protein